MKRRVLYLGLILATLGMLAWVVMHAREPSYQGRSLSYWLRLGVRSPNDLSMPAENQAALRHIGTNAIPTLLRLIAATDSPLKLKLVGLAQKQEIIRVNFISANEKNYAAARGFVILGPDATLAAPALAEIFDRDVSSESQKSVIEVFAQIGLAAKETIPVLVRGTASKDRITRVLALNALGDLCAEPEKVVPVLTKCLADPDFMIQVYAARSLGKFGPAAKSAVPALEQVAYTPTLSKATAFAAQQALVRINHP